MRHFIWYVLLIPSSWGAEGERYFTKLLQTTSTFPPAAILLVCTSCKPSYNILERKNDDDADESGKNLEFKNLLG